MILLTGSTGTIGSELARLLAARGVKFRAYVRNVKKAATLKLVNMDIVKGDLSDKAALKKGMRGVTRVFLLSSADPNQVEYQHNVIEAARIEGVTLILKQSAFGVSQDSPVSLARWHWETEQELVTSGVPYCIFRPMMFMQNLLTSADSIKRDGVIRSPMGDAKASFIDARDIARCAASVLTGTGHQGRTFDLTGPSAISYFDIAQELSKVVGHEIKYESVSLEDAKKGMLTSGVPEWMANDLTKLYEVFAAGRASVVTSSIRDITGGAARGIDEFCEDYAEAFAGELVHH
jgi:uncharacterized protein YbjT (DUF2867 family)